jgi:hypothetical protein
MEGNRIKGGKKYWVRLETQGGTCTYQKPQLTSVSYYHVLVPCTTQGLNSNQHVVPFLRASELMTTWELEFYYYGNRETWPQHEGPTLVPDPLMYMIQMGRR